MDILVLISLLTQIVFAQNLEFCQSFADNDYNMDYGYVSHLDRPTIEEIFLFIGNAYWLIDETDKTNFRVKQSTGRRINWFGSQFRVAITAELCCFHSRVPEHNISETKTDLIMTGLLYKENNTIDWANILSTSEHNPKNRNLYRNDISENIYSHVDIPNRTQIVFEPGFKPTVGFHFGDFSEHTPYCFLQQNKINKTLFERTYRCYDIDMNTSKFTNATDRVIKELKKRSNNTKGYRNKLPHNISDDRVLSNLSDSREVIAIFYRIVTYLILHKEGKAITWCTTYDMNLDQGCHYKSKFKYLINCSNYSKSIPTTDTTVLSTTDLSSTESTPKLLDSVSTPFTTLDIITKTILTITEDQNICLKTKISKLLLFVSIIILFY